MRRSVLPVAGLLWLCACATTPLHERDWVEVRTPHFEILSSLSPAETQRLVRDAELFHAAVEYVMGTPLAPAAVPTRIVAFDGRGFRRPFAVRGASGHFRLSPREASIVLRTGDGWDDTTASLRHELVHHLLRSHAGLGRHLWFDEGAAEFLSTLSVGEDGAALGRVERERLLLLRSEHWIPLIRILKAEDLEGWGDRKRALFAAESWAFVHYLNFAHGSRGRAGLGLYLRRVGEGSPHEEAVREAFGVDSDELDRRLQRYVRGDRFDVVKLRLEPAAAEPVEPRPVPTDEVLTRLGWLAISLDRPERAQRDFERALALDPRNARAEAGLGAVERLRGRFERAAGHTERALATAPDDALVQLEAGVLYRDWARASGSAEERAERIGLARRHCGLSTRIDDSLPAAFAVYGSTFLVEGEDAARGVEPLAHASGLLPSSLDLRLERARVHARLGHHQRAHALALEVLSRTHSDATRAEAREILAGMGTTILERTPDRP